MKTLLEDTLLLSRPRFGLLPRIVALLALLTVEALLIADFMHSPALKALTGAARLVHEIQHWLLPYAIAYAGSFAILRYLRGARQGADLPATAFDSPVRFRWLCVHAVLLVPFGVCSNLLYAGGDVPFALLAFLWFACGSGAVAALFAAAAPPGIWAQALRRNRALFLYALLPAAGALLAFKASQMLWAPAARVTFQLVGQLLRPFYASLRTDPSTLTVSTAQFAVQVNEPCSGLEGVGLMLAFCTAWLWYFRREYVFPRAFIIVPAAVLLIFLLNAVRIAALVVIGSAGYPDIASVGFHSQAGWIAFNLAAFGVAWAAKRSTWLNRSARLSEATSSAVPRPDDPGSRARSEAPQDDATAAYLMPLLVILAAGMIAHALSAGFDLLYPLRLVGAAIVLWVFRRSYGNVDWTFSWRGLAVGVGIFAMWAACARFLETAAPMPNDLAQLPAPLRAAWIVCRAAAAIITVPIAEELAYRGFLMRRMVSADFAALALRGVPLWAVAVSAVLFGVTHGSLWLPGIIAGMAYGSLAVRTGKLGEATIAHATTNLLVAMQVLLFGQWQLW